MMNILDIISLGDDKTYIVGAKADTFNTNYYCLLNKDKLDEVIICKSVDEETLKEENNPDVIKELMPIFYKSINKDYKGDSLVEKKNGLYKLFFK